MLEQLVVKVEWELSLSPYFTVVEQTASSPAPAGRWLPPLSNFSCC